MTNRSDTEMHALVLGATGAIGSEITRQMCSAGWRVRALKRGLVDAALQSDRITWLRGDAMKREDVLHAARGCSVIVHAVNPPGYRRWSELVLPMIDNSIAAAIAEQATIVLPGTVYNYGPDALFPVIHEDAPQNPCTRKGAIRVEMERRLRTATHDGARAIVVRAGDFFGPHAENTWFSQGLVKPGQPINSIKVPSDPGVGHQWAYLPDVARTMLKLLDVRARLDAFASFHMAGHWDSNGKKIAMAIRRVAEHYGQRSRISRFPWWMVYLAAPAAPTMRELLEMRYLWRQPIRLDGSRLRQVIGDEPHTPLDEAVEASLLGLGCIPTLRRQNQAIDEIG